MPKSATTFKAGNKAAAGASHAPRKMMTQQLTSILNEAFQGMKRVARPVTDKAGKARNGSDGKPLMEVIWEKDGKPQDITNLRKLLDNLVFNATVLSDTAAITQIFDRLEGKPVQGISGPEGEPLEATTFIVRMSSAKPPGAGKTTPAHHALAKDTTGAEKGGA